MGVIKGDTTSLDSSSYYVKNESQAGVGVKRRVPTVLQNPKP